jgi:outer membrane protein OmpA-like peptidoglycan-associated protein
MRSTTWIGVGLIALLFATGCPRQTAETTPRTTERDKTKKGAMIGAAGGAVLGAVVGEGELDEILASAALGAGLGAGVGAYMDKQEEALARIPGTTVERVDEDLLLLRFQSGILFAVDSAVVSPDARGSLDEVASVMAQYPKTAVIVQGHTDSTGGEEYNQNLSERRATAVMNHLIGRGVDGSRITAAGYGEGVPVASNDTDSGRQANRRVDILLKAKVQ